MNNNSKTCPIKMSDGRYFTNYNPRCDNYTYINNLLKENNMPVSSYEQRLFLQRNYERVVEDENKRILANLSPCVPCNPGELINETNKELDSKYMVYCNGVSCDKKLVNENGLGTGKGF
jgi:hypothetical protein